MDLSRLMAKAFLVASIASGVIVVVLISVAGSGLLARLLVDAFLAGLLTSGVASALSFRQSVPRTLQQVSIVTFGIYASTAAAVALWVLVAKPPFG